MAARKQKEMPTDVVATSENARITGFDSHGARYFRVTLPREWAQNYESPANLWNVEVQRNGVITFTPIRDLVAVPPKVPRGAKVAADSAN